MHLSVFPVLIFVECLLVEALDVNYLVNLVTKTQKKALDYKLPKNAYLYKSLPKQLHYGEFDYIVIGAGTSGSVLANRLSERKDWDVLVLEAGYFENNFTDIPAMRDASIFTRYNWGYETVPQKTSCLGMVDNMCPYHSGKGVGGSTLINDLIYARPNKNDFERLVAAGNEGWSYKELLPFFKKSENSNIPNSEPEYHGRVGPLNVEYRSPYSTHLYAFLQSNIEAGRSIIDYNGKTQIGVSTTQHNTIFGKRHSNGNAFVKPVLDRANLKLLTKAYVTRILFDDDKDTVGVEFSYKRKRFVATVKQEVILAGGAIASAQILQLSGIGPKNTLLRYNIPMVKELEVGQHLVDHPAFFGLFFETNHTEPPKTLNNYMYEYFYGVGPLTMPNNNEGVGFYRTHLAKYPNVPDLELLFMAPNSTTVFTRKILNLKNDTADALLGSMDATKTFGVVLSPLQTISKGTVEIKSRNPFEYPDIDPRLLSDPYNKDIDTIYAGILMTLELINSPPFQKLAARYAPAPLPACKKFEFLSKNYWYCAIRQLTSSMGHPSGTCRMGPNPDKGDVVDNKLRVHGVKGLRVADASIFPFPLTGHISTAATLVGEIASEFIKQTTFYRRCEKC